MPPTMALSSTVMGNEEVFKWSLEEPENHGNRGKDDQRPGHHPVETRMVVGVMTMVGRMATMLCVMDFFNFAREQNDEDQPE